MSSRDPCPQEDPGQNGENINTKRGNTSKSSRRSPKFCTVCGDKASGYNFSVMTCESCKAFFRRNATQKKPLHCPAQNTCDITVESRKFCPKCRLRKCFEVGMRPDFIMTEEELIHKRRRLTQRKIISKKQGHVLHSQILAVHMARNEEGTNGHGGMTGEDGPAENDILENLNLQQQYEIELNGNTSNPSVLAEHVPAAAEGDMVTISMPRSTFFNIMMGEGNPTIQLSTLRRAMLASMGSFPTQTPPIAQEAPSHVTNVQTGDHWANAMWPTYACPDGYVPNGDQSYYPAPPPAPEYIQSIPPLDNTAPVTINSSEDNTGATSADNSSLSPISQVSLNSITGPISSPSSPSIFENAIDFVETIPMLDWSPIDYRSPSPVLDSTYFDLRHTRLNELLMGNGEWKGSMEGWTGLQRPTDLTQDDYFSMAHFILRHIIKQHSHLNTLKRLSWNDQQALLKGAARDLLVLRASWKANLENGRIRITKPHYECALTEPTANGQHFGLRAAMAAKGYPDTRWMSAADIWRASETLMLITSAIVLFNPNQPGVVDKEAVLAEQQIYRKLLKDYLDNTYGRPQSRQAYSYIISQIDNIGPYLARSFCCPRMNFELNPETMEPMFVQISGFSENDYVSLVYVCDPKTPCYLKWSSFSALRALLDTVN